VGTVHNSPLEAEAQNKRTWKERHRKVRSLTTWTQRPSTRKRGKKKGEDTGWMIGNPHRKENAIRRRSRVGGPEPAAKRPGSDAPKNQTKVLPEKGKQGRPFVMERGARVRGFPVSKKSRPGARAWRADAVPEERQVQRALFKKMSKIRGRAGGREKVLQRRRGVFKGKLLRGDHSW